MNIGPILVTGATGLVGRHVVRELLGRGHTVFALARSRDGETARERVVRAVGPVAHGWLGVVDGDLTRPQAGLDDDTMHALRVEVVTVVHCAADTRFSPGNLAGFRRTLIEGPVELLRGLAGGSVRRWAHLSTAFVCGRRTGTVLESEGEVGQSFRNPYERAKLESEAAMRSAAARLGIDLRILRPSIVVGAGVGTRGAHPSQMFFALIRMAATLAQSPDGGQRRLSIPVRPHAKFNVIPVEDVAVITAAVTVAPAAAGGTFHVVATEPPTYDQVRAVIAERLGAHSLRLVDPRFGQLLDPTPLETAVVDMLAPYRDYLDDDVTFDDRALRRVLDACATPPPRLDTRALHRMIDRALAESGAADVTAAASR